MIQQAEIKDWPSIIPLAREFYIASGYGEQFELPYNEQKMVWIVINVIKNPNGIILVVEESKKIVGFLAGIVVPWVLDPEVLAAQELAWWISPEHRKGRSAIELVNNFRLWAKSKGATFMCMSSIKKLDGDKINAIYERLGMTHMETAYAEYLKEAN